jgi:uncharacterized protein
MRFLHLVCCAAVAASIATSALADPSQLVGRVNDYAHVLSPDQIAKLAGELKVIEDKTSTHDQVAVLTTPSLDGADIESYSIAVARKWELGQKNLDNGVLITIAPNDHEARIEVGRRLEPVLTDVTSKMILHKDMAPYLHDKDYYGALEAGVADIAKILRSPEGAPAAPALQAAPDDSGAWVLAGITVICVIAAIIFLFFMVRSNPSSRDDDSDPLPLDEHESDEEDGESPDAALAIAGAATAAAMGHHHPHREPEPEERETTSEESSEEERHDDDDGLSIGKGFGGSSEEDTGGGFSSDSGLGGFSGGGGTFGGGGASEKF